ncbi:MAG TPA: PCP reductase family protein, partial [Candidatus Polarisedimenticolaceae bacterium]|nr:PCP reductase family protein [Candidatus Polarisedimenticolaceae bacterium]
LPAAEEGAAEERPLEPGLRLIARDAKHNPLISALDWSSEAVERLFRVPAGYMRDQTQRRTETIAEENGLPRIELATVEQGIEIGRRLMDELLSGQTLAARPAAAAATDRPDASKCPFSGIYTGGVVPSEHRSPGDGDAADSDGENGEPYLNEIGILSAMAERRAKLEK